MSGDAKCVCGHTASIHLWSSKSPSYGVCQVPGCYCRDLRLTEEAKPESVYERARKALYEVCSRKRSLMSIPLRSDDPDVLIHDALDAGEKAERYVQDLMEKCRINRERAESAEGDIRVAIEILKPARPEDGLLPAVRDVLQRLALAEAAANKEGDES